MFGLIYCLLLCLRPGSYHLFQLGTQQRTIGRGDKKSPLDSHRSRKRPGPHGHHFEKFICLLDSVTPRLIPFREYWHVSLVAVGFSRTSLAARLAGSLRRKVPCCMYIPLLPGSKVVTEPRLLRLRSQLGEMALISSCMEFLKFFQIRMNFPLSHLTSRSSQTYAF